MQKLVLDQATLDKLKDSAIPVEVVDTEGKSQGRFYLQPHNPLWDLFPYSDEEFEAMAKEPGGRTTEEVIRDLRNRS